MAHEEHIEGGAESGQSGLSRRKLIVTGATLAAAGVAVGVAIPLATSSATGDSASAASGPAPEEPVMVHLKDANSGQLDLFVGTRRISFTDRGMAAQLVKAANNAT